MLTQGWSPHQEKGTLLRCTNCQDASFSAPRSPRRIAANTLRLLGLRPCISWSWLPQVHGEIAWSRRESGVQSQKAGRASGFTGSGKGLVDFPEQTSFNFRNLLRAYAEDAPALG